MSRIGRLPIPVPAGVEITLDGQAVTVKGPKGTLSHVVSEPIRRMVMKHADMGAIEEEARRLGMRTMYEDGLVKALQGVTTIEEVLRVTQES